MNQQAQPVLVQVNIEAVPPPKSLGPCAQCFWWRGKDLEFYLVNGQMVPKAAALQVGIPIGAATIKQRRCTRHPNWLWKPPEEWCGDFDPQAREETRT